MRTLARHLLNSRAFEVFHDWAFPPPTCQRSGCLGPCDNVFHNMKTRRVKTPSFAVEHLGVGDWPPPPPSDYDSDTVR